VIWGVVLQGAVDRRTRQLKEAKRESERMRKLFESVFESAPVMIMLLDEDNRFERVNKQFETVLGWTEEELLARDDAWTLLYPDDTDRRETLAFVDGAPMDRLESRPKTRDGRGGERTLRRGGDCAWAWTSPIASGRNGTCGGRNSTPKPPGGRRRRRAGSSRSFSRT